MALAKQLVAAAAAADKQPGLLGVICQKAYDLASKDPAGYPTAVEAMELLAEKDSSAKVDALEKMVLIRQQVWHSCARGVRAVAANRWIRTLMRLAEAKAADDPAAALPVIRKAVSLATSHKSWLRDAALAKAELIDARARATRKASELLEKLQADEADGVLRRKLILLYVVDLDKVEEANRLLRPGSDEVLRTCVPLAAKDPQELAEEACLEMGKWYASLAEEASALGKRVVASRAAAYLRTYLEKHATEDATRTRAKLRLQQIEWELEAMGGKPISDGVLVFEEKFDSPIRSGLMAGWQAQVQPGDAVAVAKEDNNRFLAIACRKGPDAYVQRSLPLDRTWGSVTVFAKVKARKLKRGSADENAAKLTFSVKDAAGLSMTSSSSKILVFSDCDWRPVSKTVALPRGARKLRMTIGLFGTKGKLGVDDIRIYADATPVAIPWKRGFPRGRFGQLGPGGTPRGWSMDPRLVKVVREGGHSIVRLASPDGKKSIWLKTYVRLKPRWRALRLTARVRATGMQKNPDYSSYAARIAWSYQSDEAITLGESLDEKQFNTDTDWTTVTLESQVPSGACRVSIRIGLYYIPGTFDVDWVKLEPITKAALKSRT